jgi:hypothetical protein
MNRCNVVVLQVRIKAMRPQRGTGAPDSEVSMPDPDSIDSQPASAQPVPAEAPEQRKSPQEIGGRNGLEPTRYGDWEKDGRCIDF